MTREKAIIDLEDLFERQPDEIPRERAFAIHGYLKGFCNAGILNNEDYARYRKRIPLDGEDLAEAGVNL
ncbi:hypothetical protein [Longimonas sp.]|uniref:hypothetical protein n=1 Tax=Longimonas sp. TaxID=2039626 RepID=UPI003975B18A